MFAVIFGHTGCPYCVRAKQLAEKLTEERDDFNFRYVDIHAEGITKADLEKTVGKPIETVPQIFLDEKDIGGCTDFENLRQRKPRSVSITQQKALTD
ncbi:GrxA family glutaredoxin [Serratia symbiotica]|nr:GrxA family glutaredoxin [Serratia symbiotica]